MSILYMQLNIVLSACGSLKERRAVAQRLRDQLKNQFNVSVKLEYHELRSCFSIYICAIGSDKDYLENLAESLHLKAEALTEEQIDAVYDIENWPI